MYRGGALIATDYDGTMALPIGKAVEVDAGTELWFEEVTADYDDDSYTQLVGVTINGEQLDYLPDITADKDMKIRAEFIRIKDTDESSVNLPRFKAEGGRIKNGIKLTNANPQEIEIYGSRTGELLKEEEPWHIVEISRYREGKPKRELITDENEINDMMYFSEDNSHLIIESIEDKCYYNIRVQRRKDGGIRTNLRLRVGLDELEPLFPIAKGEGIEFAGASGTIIRTSNGNQTINELLKDQTFSVCGVTLKGWTNEKGRDIGNETLSSLVRDGIAEAIASYTDYTPVVIEKPEMTQLFDLKQNEDGQFVFADSGKAVQNAFIDNGDYVYYLDGNGYPYEGDPLIEVAKNTVWYKEYSDEYGDVHYYAIRPDQSVEGKVLYYLENGKILTEAWLYYEYDNDNGAANWYYFGQAGRAYVDSAWTIGGKSYRFDEGGRCLLPGWFWDGEKIRYLDNDGNAVKNAFAADDENPDLWSYIGKDGYLAEEAQVVRASRNTRWYTQTAPAKAASVMRDGDQFDPGTTIYSYTPDENYKYRDIYYLINEAGEIATETWNDDGTMYFGKTGKAYQGCSAVIEDENGVGTLYTFTKAGEAEAREPIDNDKPSKVAAEIEKLDLQMDAEDVNTRDEALNHVEEAVEVILPMGFSIATISDAERAGANAFKEATDKENGFWKYDVTIYNGMEEDVATPTTPSRASRVRVSTGSTADKKFYATAEYCELTIIASGKLEDNISDELETVGVQAGNALDELKLTQKDVPDEDAARKAIEDAVNKLLPEGYQATFSYQYQAPEAGTKANAEGRDGRIEVTILITDDNEYSLKIEKKSIVIAATAYVDGGSQGGNGDNPDDDKKPEHHSTGGSGGGASTTQRRAVTDTRGSWQQDASGWRFVITSTGTYAQNAWHRVNGRWYYFGENTYAVKGWNLIDGKWYYMDAENCWMETGWHDDKQDGNWYLLNEDGSLALGWVQVNGKYYFLNNVSAGPTYVQDAATGAWSFNGNQNLPYGAMLRGTTTPDGYYVGADGAWDGNAR